jgi:hypothetical protein
MNEMDKFEDDDLNFMSMLLRGTSQCDVEKPIETRC